MSPKPPTVEPHLVKARMRLIGAARQFLEGQGYLEVQTPALHSKLSGFEKGTGFSTFSSSLGERLWFRAAPELYLKRLLIDCQPEGIDKLFEVATCLRDDFDEQAPRESFDRPELTLLELYSCAEDPWDLEGLLRGLIEQAIGRLEGEGLLRSKEALDACARLRGEWERREFAGLLRTIDGRFDLEALLRGASERRERASGSRAALQAQAIEARAGDARLRDAAANVAYQAGGLTPYLRVGPQGYWFDFIEHAFQIKVAPALTGPVILHRFPLESSPMAQSEDGIHCDKWELYVGGLRVALAQRELMDAQAQKVRFQHLDRLRRLGYELLPEPDESFLDDLERWPPDRPLIGMGVYIDRLAGFILGLLGSDGRGQERMLPNLVKQG